MRKKILIFMIGLILGIGLFINFESFSPYKMVLLSVIISLFLYLIRPNLIILPLALCLGFGLSAYKFSNFKLMNSTTNDAIVTITEKRETKDGFRYFIRVKAKEIDEKSVIFTEESYEIGDKFLVDIKTKIPNRNTNPNLFNYRNYLISKNVASIVEFNHISKEGVTRSFGLKLRAKFYNYIHEIFDTNLSLNSRNFIISVILGEGLIDNEDIKDLGLTHILAVSGLHIDLLMGFILYILRKLNINYKISYTISVLLCLLYGYLIGFPYSVIRVLIIHTIGFLAFLFCYPEDKIKSLMIAAIGILLINPFAILNSGFILSFVATSGVYLVYPKLKTRLGPNEIANSIGFTAAIQLTLLPFTIYYYGRVNLVSILANFLIVPVFTLGAYISFTLICLYPLLRFILLPAFKILDYIIYSILNLTRVLNSIKFLAFDFAHPSLLASIYLYVLILVIIYIKRSNKAILRRFYATSFLALVLSVSYQVFNPEVSFSMIDIGQGDAFLLNDGGDYYLFDVGGPKYKDYDSGERILIPYLKSLGIKEIKGVFISHEDNDHSGNLDILYENFKIDNLITSRYNLEGLKKYQPKEIKLGQQIKLNNAEITCIYDGSEGKENAESMGLLINIKGTTILTLGDLDSEYEDELDVKADILKVSHHGSRNSTSKNFVEKVSPKAALISAGRNNTYGHPSKEVIENLAGVKIYNTQDKGMVKIVFNDKVKIESYLRGGYFR